MVAFLYRMGSGIPGDITRQSIATVEPVPKDPATPFAGFGLFGKISGTGKFVPVGAGDVAASIYGLFVRPFPTQGANASDPLGTSVPSTLGIADVLRRGYANVVVNGAAAPAMGGTVYIRVATPAAGKPIGGIEAAADGANTIVVPTASFMSAADANGNVEIAYNI
jgi:hypothetical protein